MQEKNIKSVVNKEHCKWEIDYLLFIVSFVLGNVILEA